MIILLLFIFLALFILYYFFPFYATDSFQILLTISTFLYAVFAGFTMSRQSTRHEDIRERVAQFDGNLTSIYRSAMCFDKNLQIEVGNIVKSHYKKILDTLSWDYHFNHKSSTITDIHLLLKQKLAEKKFDDFGKAILAQVEWSLRDLQRVRKDLVSLYQERIPTFQWILLYILAGILVLTISMIPSYLVIFLTLLKVSFVGSIFVIMYLLHRLNSVKLFEGTIGESSAKDVIDIIDGKK